MKFLKNALPAIAAMLIFSACGKDYYDVIPKDAPAVGRFDLSALALHLGGGNASPADVFPFAAGVDPAQPAYVFVSPSGYLGMVMAVRDESAVRAAFDSSRDFSAREKKGGKDWALWRGRWQVASDDDALLVIGPVTAAGRDDACRMASAMLRSSEGVSSGELFPMLEQGGASSLVMRLSAMPALLGRMAAVRIADDPDSVVVKAGIRLSARELVFSNELVRTDGSRPSPSPSVTALRGFFNNIKLPASCLAILRFGANGPELWRRISHDKQWRPAIQALRSCVDVEKLFAAISGDMVVALQGASGDGEPRMSLYAQTAGDSFVRPGAGGGKLRVSVGGGVTRIEPRTPDSEHGDSLIIFPKPEKGAILDIHLDPRRFAASPLIGQLFGGGLTAILDDYSEAVLTAADATHSKLVFRKSDMADASRGAGK